MEGFGRAGFAPFRPSFGNIGGNVRSAAGGQPQPMVSPPKTGFVGVAPSGGFTGPATFARGQGRGQAQGFGFQGQNKDSNARPSNRNSWSSGFAQKAQEKPKAAETSFRPSFGNNPQFSKPKQGFAGFSNVEQNERFDKSQRFPKTQFLNKSDSNDRVERLGKQDLKGQQERPARQNRPEPSERQERPDKSKQERLESFKIQERKYENPKFQAEDDQPDLEKTERALRQKALNTFNMIKRRAQLPESRAIKPDLSAHKLDTRADIRKSNTFTAQPGQSTLSALSAQSAQSTLSTLQTEKGKLRSFNQEEPKQVPHRPPVRSSTYLKYEEPEQVAKPQRPASSSAKPQSKPPGRSEPSASVSFKMCSEEESRSREESNQLSIFERIPGTTQFKSEWTVKKYLRSSADRADYKRDAEDLSTTLNYLVSEILDVDSNGNPNLYEYQEGCESHSYQDIYPFLFDRMRAVLKDWKILNANDSDEYIKDHEMIARFLIMSCVEGLVYESFNLNLNLKLAEDVLTCLAKVYEKRRKQGVQCPNQAEFLCYLIITKPDNMLIIMSMLKGLPDELVNSSYMQLAIYLLTCYQNNDYEEFFNTVYEAPYLVACAAYPLFHKIRISIFDILISQKVNQIEFGLFKEMLALYDEEEARMYIQEFELELAEDASDGKMIVTLEPIQEKLRNRNFSVLPSDIQSKNKLETRLQVISTPGKVEEEYEESDEDSRPADSPAKVAQVSELPKKPQHVEAPQALIKKPEAPQAADKLLPEASLVKLQAPEQAAPKPSLFQGFTPQPSTPPLSSFLPGSTTSTFPLARAEENKPAPSAFSPLSALSALSAPSDPSALSALLAPSAPSAPSAPVKQVKKLNFEFPFDDKQFFSIIRDKKTKDRIKENIRNYRSDKKLREKSKKRQVEILIKMKVLNAWKTIVNQKKLEKYFENRKLKEMEAFKLQFSDLIISDAINFQRYLSKQDAVRI